MITKINTITEYIESNNEISFNSLSINNFANINFKKDKTGNYIFTGQTNYITVLAMIGNLRQIMWEIPNYTEQLKTINTSKALFDTIITFDGKTKAITNIKFNLNKASISDIEDFRFKDIEISLNNTSYDISNIYVPIEIEINAERINDKTLGITKPFIEKTSDKTNEK